MKRILSIAEPLLYGAIMGLLICWALNNAMKCFALPYAIGPALQEVLK